MSELPQAVLIARALGRLRDSVPGGPNGIAVAAMEALAQIGDLAALEAAEDRLATNTVGISYGDRDDDPPDWEPDPRTFAALAGWWGRLGLRESRAAWLAAGALGDRQPRGEAARSLFWRMAPHVAEHAAPLLIAALEGAPPARRARAAYALGSAATDASLGALILLLGDADEETRRQAALAIGVAATPQRLRAPVVALASPPAPAPLLRAGSTDQLPADSARHCYAALSTIVDRADLLTSLVDLARLLADPDPAVRRRAAWQVRGALAIMDKLAPEEAARLAHMLAAGPPDLPALLADPDPAVGEAALALAGRAGEGQDPARRSALIIAVAERLSGPQQLLAIMALERLRARDALGRLRAILGDPRHPAHRRAPIVLGRLGDQGAVPGLEALLALGLYAAEALEVLGELRRASGQPAGGPAVRYGELGLSRHELAYLARHGGADALARVQRTEEYAFAAAHAHRCSDADLAVEVARQIESRLLRAAGLAQAAVDDPAEAVRRALTAPVHPSRLEDRFGGPIERGELRARWQDMCLALERHTRAEQPPADAIALAEELLAGWPDEPRVAHERWWLDVLRSQAAQLVYSRQVIRAAPLARPSPALALARAIVIGPALSSALDPAATLAWLAQSAIAIVELDPAPHMRERWGRALEAADEALRARVRASE